MVNIYEQLYNMINHGAVSPMEMAFQIIVSRIMSIMTIFTIAFCRTKY
jgi:hypothetical protein